MLTVRGVSLSFGGLRALEDISLEVRRGEVLGVIGPNGAGKTTLFNVICGFAVADRGSISWLNGSLDRVRPQHLAGLGIGRTLQGLGLFEHLTALENVVVGADCRARTGFLAALLALPRMQAEEQMLKARALGLMADLGIGDVADRLPGALPYPVRKRVALARALVAEPQLLLLDEPAAGLSETELADLADLIRSLRADAAVMLVEHHMDLVMAVCDRIVVLDFGRVIATGTPDEIRASAAVTDAYLGRAVTP
jgi:branched-chain amino acid transport system ATP-binding protein